MTSRRILVVDDDALILAILEKLLTDGGFQVETVKEPTRVVPRAQAFQPHLILLDRQMPVLTGYEVIRALRSFPTTAGMPVAFLTSDGGELEVLRGLRTGAVDVIAKPFGLAEVQRVRMLLDELATRGPKAGASGDERLLWGLLGVYARTHKTGQITVNPGTPFEGRAVFRGGELKSAEFGPARGVDALREMLTLENGVWKFDADAGSDGPEPQPARRDQPITLADLDPGDARPLVLVVDDDPELRRLFRAQLSRAGFDVEVAEDGIAGAEAALAKQYDLVIADLNMPRLDGWGMLKQLQADHRTRELKVVFLSAHDDYRETLKAARAGAHDYLAKTGRAEDVVLRVRTLVEPRQLFLDELGSGRPSLVSALKHGLQWLLRTLEARRATGTLDLSDEWARYRLSVNQGVPVEASAVWPKRLATGIGAIASLLVSRSAEGTFTPGKVSEGMPLGAPLGTLVDRALASLNQVETKVTATRISAADAFVVDEVLYDLYRQVGSDRGVELARAVCEARIPVAQLPAKLGQTAVEVQEGIKELLRRGVLSFREG